MVKIRPAKVEDLKRCEEVFRIPELKTPGGEFLTAEMFSNYISDDYFLIAENDKEMIGAIYGEELKAGGVLIWLFAVNPTYRGQGIGTALLQEFEANSRKNNRHWIYLVASTMNEKTIRFYQKNGYDKGSLNYECAKELN
ncbi:MAG: GNAT family N-acetyltransferase [Candidatus Berkelbacteria bacterium]|nr:GNAT family N-acetyltransferase [Candidatus Berkelbacteria bacterium]